MTFLISRKFFLFFSVFVLLISFLYIFSDPAQAAIVKCGTTENPQRCGICDIFKLASDIINYSVTYLVPAIATLLFLFAGFFIIIGGADPGQVKRGKDIFWTTTRGLLIIYSAWLVANSVVHSLAGENNVSDSWFNITCNESLPIDIDGGGGGENINKKTKELAQTLINSEKILFDRDNGDCGSSYTPYQNVVDMSGGKYPAVCSPECQCKEGGATGNITVSSSILEGLLFLSSKYPDATIMVTSLTTGRHVASSKHYKGLAVDLVITLENKSQWAEARDYLKSQGGNAFCEKDNTIVSDCTTANHIHWEITAGQTGGSTTIGTCTGAKCNIGANFCRPNSGADCIKTGITSGSPSLSDQINTAASGAKICENINAAAMIKAIVSQENPNLDWNAVTSVTQKDGTVIKSIGLFQMQVGTALGAKKGCTTDNIDEAWLKNPENLSKIVCIVKNYLSDLSLMCDCNVRQLAAGYNGGNDACLGSTNCGSSAGNGNCQICGQTMKAWECPWDNNDHSQCNVGFQGTRSYAPKVEYCYSQFQI